MLEQERFELSQLRDELRAVADEAERLGRALADVGIMAPRPAPPGGVHGRAQNTILLAGRPKTNEEELKNAA